MLMLWFLVKKCVLVYLLSLLLKVINNTTLYSMVKTCMRDIFTAFLSTVHTHICTRVSTLKCAHKLVRSIFNKLRARLALGRVSKFLKLETDSPRLSSPASLRCLHESHANVCRVNLNSKEWKIFFLISSQLLPQRLSTHDWLIIRISHSKPMNGMNWRMKKKEK